MKKVVILTIIYVPLIILCLCIDRCSKKYDNNGIRHVKQIAYSNGGYKKYRYDYKNRVSKIISLREPGRKPSVAKVSYRKNTITIDSETGFRSTYRLDDHGYVETHSTERRDCRDAAIHSVYTYGQGCLSQIENKAYHQTFTWENGNISRYSYAFYDAGGDAGQTYTLIYTYTDTENKFHIVNPFGGIFDDEFEDLRFRGNICRNLPASCREYDSEDNILSDYSYAYELDEQGCVAGITEVDHVRQYSSTTRITYHDRRAY